MKRLLALVIALILASTLALPALAEVDTSEEVNLVFYLLGDTPKDLAIVTENLNVILKEKLNCTIELRYLSWSEYNDKYPLVLMDTDTDLIYTSDWAFYTTEAAKGAFFELTDEFMSTYLPMTLASQEPSSFLQARLSGRLFAIPKNDAGLENESWIVIRQDLATKYGFDTIDDLATLEAYFTAIVENESGIYPYYASESGGFEALVRTQPNNLVYMTNLDWCYAYQEGVVPSFDEIGYSYFREDAIPYFELMKSWYEKGFWPASAINNTVHVRDSFENGTSASLVWNATIFSAGKNLEANNAEWQAGYYDINPDTIRRRAMYTNDCIAIAALSENKERAAMFIDLVKNDKDVYLALVGGIEGVHYILAEDGTRSEGPDAANYPWNGAAWCFNLSYNDRIIASDANPIEEAFVADQEKYVAYPATSAFRFDAEPVKAELAAINALRDEYRPMLSLGLVDDIAGTIAEWKAEAEAEGLAIVEAEMRRQYEEWLATLG